jgi:ubiquinone/menaquinone biosynthesis C-methylase UbiE
VKAAYDRLAPVYDRRWRLYTEATLSAALEGIEPGPEEVLLDLGAGTGELTRRLLARRPAPLVVALDLSREMLLAGQHKRLSSRALLVQGSAARLPFASESFDWVLNANSFHHFEAPRLALAEMQRVLRPAGRLIITDWCDDYLSCRLYSLYLRLFDRSFRGAYTLAECERMLTGAGFDVVSARRFKIDWLWGLMRLDARRR